MVVTSPWTVETDSAAATRALGECLGGLLDAGDTVALSGELGAGKTTLAAGIGVGLAVPEPLRSPTYLLCEEYVGRHPVLHLDAYFDQRLENLLGEGLAERLASGAVVLVEWPERVAEWLPVERLAIRLEGQDDRRRLAFDAAGERHSGLLADLRAAWLASGQGKAQNP